MKLRIYTKALLAIAYLVVGAGVRTTVAETTTSPQMLDVRQVALFKNGLGFFVGEAACPKSDATFRVRLPASPSHGTLWISYPSGVALASAVAREVQSEEIVEAVTIPELLKANLGQEVKLLVGDKEIAGIIANFAEDRQTARPDPYAPGGRTGEPESRDPWGRQQAGLATIKTDSGMVCVNPRAVTNVTFAREKIELQCARKLTKTELEVRLKKPARGKNLTVTFLAKGVTWAPSYMVDISDARKARISGKAVIVNDACVLEDVAVQLVTGFPHLEFADVVAPMAMKENLAKFLQALSKGESERVRADIMYNVMTQQRASYRGRRETPMPAYGAADVGQTAEDLFLYPAGPIDLGRDEVAYVPLFTESIPYEHIYQWDIPDYVDEDGRYQYDQNRQGQQQQEQVVWHSLRLTNATRMPWTTAPGETVKNGVILGQDTVSYTPAGGEGTLRITRAVGIKADQIELETGRKREATRLYGYSYDLITVRGELSVTNAQDKPVKLEITKMLSGEVKSADPEAKREKLAKGLRRMNGLMKLTWTIDLAAGAEKELSYVYEVYVRR